MYNNNDRKHTLNAKMALLSPYTGITLIKTGTYFTTYVNRRLTGKDVHK